MSDSRFKVAFCIRPRRLAVKDAEGMKFVGWVWMQKADQTPHIVREADGCKVYAFKSGDRWHFFTRCPNATTVTDTAYEHCTGTGKSRRCEELHDSIETRN